MLKKVNTIGTKITNIDTIKNGNFSYPVVGSVANYAMNTVLPTNFKTSFVWDFVNNEDPVVTSSATHVIVKGNYVSDINPSIVGENQYMMILNRSKISQSIDIKQIGKYKLSFYYCKRKSHVFNMIDIYINDVLLDSISNGSEDKKWDFYSKIIYLNKLNNLKISFIGRNKETFFAVFVITKVSFSLIEFDYTSISSKLMPINNSNQIISQTYDKITEASLKETPQVEKAKKWIGGTKNTDSSAYIKKKTSNAITSTRV